MSLREVLFASSVRRIHDPVASVCGLLRVLVFLQAGNTLLLIALLFR